MPEDRAENRGLDLPTELALIRTELALERTQLAWVRAAFSFISTGFAVDKGVLALHEARVLTGRNWVGSSHFVGFVLISFSTAFLALATVAYVRQSAQLERLRPKPSPRFRTCLPVTAPVVLLGTVSNGPGKRILKTPPWLGLTLSVKYLLVASMKRLSNWRPLLILIPAIAAFAADSPSTSLFLPTVENKFRPADTGPEGMVWIPGGEFSMGSDVSSEALCGLPGVTRDAQPIHRVYVDGFWMDKTEVTNDQFEKFVKATGYKTIAEIAPTQAEFPTAPPENLVAGSTVFTPTTGPVPLDDIFQWWRYEKGADWRHPEGPQSGIIGKGNFPVVQVAYPDAVAYAKWAGKRLPTEAEWEFAARGGLTGKLYAWGDELRPNGKWMANIYEGTFPQRDSGDDGFVGLAPVAQFPANGYGLFDVAGNAWEWVSDWYRPDYFARLKLVGGVPRNPQGPDSSFDPVEPTEKKRVHKGGSFLCSDQYCTRYMVGTRGKGEVTTASNHVGFRCVQSPRK